LGQNSGRYDTRTRYQATNRLTKIPEKGLFGVFFGEPSDFKRLKTLALTPFSIISRQAKR